MFPLGSHYGGTAAVIAAAVLWGTAGTVGALVPGRAAEPVALAAARLVVGGAVLATAAGPAARRLLTGRDGEPGRASTHAGGRVLPLVAGALAVAAYQLCY